MPYGRHRWQCGQGRESCPRPIHRFLEPCLLLLLHCTESYGYQLVEGLKEFGFEQNPVDTSTVYRVLRSLEEQALAVSHWDTEGAGPARRLYKITEEGDQFLAAWVDGLQQTDRMLHHFLATYDDHMEAHR